MAARLGLVFSLFAAGAAGQSSAQWAEFGAQVQKILDWGSSSNLGVGVSFAWKDSERELQMVAGGTVNRDGSTRQITTEDTFLYGSGTKSFTAAAIMRLVEEGKISLDDPAEKHVNPWMQRHANVTLQQCWGPQAAQVTVGHLIEMRSGIVDYDNTDFDTYVLQIGEGVVDPLQFICYPNYTGTPFICAPGTCVEYSSTNFVLAGIVLLQHSGSDDWTTLVTKSFYPKQTQRELAGVSFLTDQPLQPMLTTTAFTGGWVCTPPGSKNCTRGPAAWIAPQNGSIVGYTCANAVAAPRDVARFFYSLVAERTIVSQKSLDTMQNWRIMDKGWAAGYLYYGAGLMLSTVGRTRTPKTFDGWGTYIGHGGEVYGYVSAQGYMWGLNASVSLVMNSDQVYPSDSQLVCLIVQAAANVLHGKTLDLQCIPSTPAPVERVGRRVPVPRAA
eukprot:TRINITY_DN272_c0_g1_i1.p1 TRINITY_DN272_c0_g1~~TRINITY_DN272_c0_g1_i1.p1  ORF type:complete len:443 (+),score=146.98 TRINITY_DN272_c0_g1_i1:95-1423(+)